MQQFADGTDECQEIELSADGIKQIIAAIKSRQLPETTGFFFGTSHDSDEQIAYDIEVFVDASEEVDALGTEEPDVWRSVSYRASW